MKDLISWGRTWAATAKAAVLFLLPLPLALALAGALITGNAQKAAFAGAGLACLWSAALVVLNALIAEARYVLGERPDPPAVPLKLVSAALTAAGAWLAALAGNASLPLAAIVAALGVAGHAAFYGRDLRPARIRVAVVEGVDRAAVTLQLKEAHARVRRIEAAARSIASRELRDQLSRITGTARSILAEVERDPADAARARRFFNLYLQSAEQVTLDFARANGRAETQPVERNFRKLLIEMENTFAEQHRRLVERDLLSLDVDIEVLNARLKSEGLG